MNWSKGFLIFSLFVLGVSVIYFVVTSYQLRGFKKKRTLTSRRWR